MIRKKRMDDDRIILHNSRAAAPAVSPANDCFHCDSVPDISGRVWLAARLFMKSEIFVLAILLVFINTDLRGQSHSSCQVTTPNGSRPPGEQGPGNYFGGGWFGNGKLYTALWQHGTVIFRPGGYGQVLPDGSLAIKWMWWRGDDVIGRFSITGSRLDAPAPPLRAEFVDPRDRDFQPSEVIFPTEGCWEINAAAGGSTLRLITRVVDLRRDRKAGWLGKSRDKSTLIGTGCFRIAERQCAMVEDENTHALYSLSFAGGSLPDNHITIVFRGTATSLKDKCPKGKAVRVTKWVGLERGCSENNGGY
jgi:hypothetical protein